MQGGGKSSVQTVTHWHIDGLRLGASAIRRVEALEEVSVRPHLAPKGKCCKWKAIGGSTPGGGGRESHQAASRSDGRRVHRYQESVPCTNLCCPGPHFYLSTSGFPPRSSAGDVHGSHDGRYPAHDAAYKPSNRDQRRPRLRWTRGRRSDGNRLTLIAGRRACQNEEYAGF